MDCWQPPEGIHPFNGTISVALSMLGPEDYRCPAGTAMKARRLRPVDRQPWKRKPLEDFPLGPFMSVRDEAEGLGRDDHHGERPLVHDGLRTWTARAAELYDRAFPGDGGSPLVPIETPWVYRTNLRAPDHRGAVRYEIKAWGRQMASPDGRYRELRLPVIRPGRQRTDAERAVAALVAAEGTPGPLPERVRVVQICLTDGQVGEPLFEGGRDAARELFAEHGQQTLEDVVDRFVYRPGSACVSCAYAALCPGLPRAPGLLGVDDRRHARRSWSPTNGRTYRICPARDFIRRIKLPAEWGIEHSAAADRGRAVHDYLARRHATPAPQCCTADIPSDWADGTYPLPEDELTLGRRLLGHHSSICPLRRARVGSLQVEPSLTFYDEDANVIVITRPDLLYQDGGSWVWREVKTRTKRRTGRLLDENPQLALAVLMIGGNLLGGSRERSRVELELLYPDGADLEIIDPFTPSVMAAARAVVTEHVNPWHADTRALPHPGDACATCEVARWCTARTPAEGTA
jgi:hypothetical protein